MNKTTRRSLNLVVLLLVAVSLLGIQACAGDPMSEIYTENIYPGTPGTYSVGSDDYHYSEGWFDSLYAGNLTVTGTSTFNDQIILNGDGEVWIEFRPDLDFTSVRALGKPDWVTRGIFGGFSLPIYAADNEELFFEICVPERWKGPAWVKLGDVGDGPGGMAVYGGSLYIPMEGDDTVWEYDGTTLSVSGTVGDEPHYATTFDGNLYVSCSGDDAIWVFDGVTWSLSGNVGNHPEGMAVFGGSLYVACRLGDEVWRLSGGVWAVDIALGAGGVAGAVGDAPRYMSEYGGDLYVGCAGVDDDVWIRSAGAWAKDFDVGNNPAEFQEHNGDLFLNCELDDILWRKSGGVWAVITNVQNTLGISPIGLEEYEGSLYSACQHSIWSDHHTVDAYAVPFWNVNSDFSVPVEDDEPMFLMVYEGRLYTSCYASDSIWVYEGQTAKVTIHVWITNAQGAATDAFRIQISHESFTPDDDIVSATSEDLIREIVTGVAAQFHSYGLHIPVDMTGVEGDDSMTMRVRRIASSDEIAGEVVIQHLGIIFKCDKLGSEEP